MSISEVAFEFIGEKKEFAYGKYDDFKVIVMLKNGYINATKMCSDNGREFKKWSKTLGAQELISEVEKIRQAQKSLSENAMILIKGGGLPEHKVISGTYVHQLLVPHLET